MTWMDSYYKIHRVVIGWMDCDDDMIEWMDDVLDPLHAGISVESIMWATSALLALTSHPVPKCITPRVYWWACNTIEAAIEQAIETRLGVAAGCP